MIVRMSDIMDLVIALDKIMDGSDATGDEIV